MKTMEQNYETGASVGNVILLLMTFLGFIVSHTMADEFRAWTSWFIGVGSFIIFLIVNADKLQTNFKKYIMPWFRKKASK